VDLRPLFEAVSKAKTAKIVRRVLDALARVPGTTDLQLRLCAEQAQWARDQKRTFLKQRLEARLAALYLETQQFQPALRLIGALLREVKKLDDKLLLVDIHLLESRVHHSLRSYPKAKAALTAARTNANAIYVPPTVQAQIDAQAGTLSAEEGDYKTAYSYFFEAFEQRSSLDSPEAAVTLKYMLMCKVMNGEVKEVPHIIQAKGGLKYGEGQPGVEAMKRIARAYEERSLGDFQVTLEQCKAHLEDDVVVKSHLLALYGTLMEKNLCKIIEPYARVGLAHVAKVIGLSEGDVERKLSQMILDGKVQGTLDQGAGYLIVFEEAPASKSYGNAAQMVANLGTAVETLMLRSQKIAA